MFVLGNVLRKVVGLLHGGFDGNVVGSIAVPKVVTKHKKGHTHNQILLFLFYFFIVKTKKPFILVDH